jgi:hypothetical protein
MAQKSWKYVDFITFRNIYSFISRQMKYSTLNSSVLLSKCNTELVVAGTW